MTVARDAFSLGTSGVGDLAWVHVPVGVPRGIVVAVVSVGATNPSTLCTYGGVTMRKMPRAPLLKATPEVGAVDLWFLGSGIPTGPQTVFVGVGADANNKAGKAWSLTNDIDTEVIDVRAVSSDSIANPGMTLKLLGRSAWCGMALLSGQDLAAGVTPAANWTEEIEGLFGTGVAAWHSYNIVGTADVVAQWTQAADDAVALSFAIGGATLDTNPHLLEKWNGANGTYQRGGLENFDAPYGLSKQPSSGLGYPPLWGPQYALDLHGAGQRAFIAYHFRNNRIMTAAHEFFLISETMADNGFCNVLSGKHDGNPGSELGANDLIWRFDICQVAGALVLFVFVRFDGTDPTSLVHSTTPIVIGFRYRIEVEWNLDAATYKVWLGTNGAEPVLLVSGNITGNPLTHPWELTDVQPGGAALDTADCTTAAGPVLVYPGTRRPSLWRWYLSPGGPRRRRRRQR